MIKKLFIGFRKFLGSRLFLAILFGLFMGITAISPDILTNPTVFGNYIGFILLNAFMNDFEVQIQQKEYEHDKKMMQMEFDIKIKDLQNQINNLKRKEN